MKVGSVAEPQAVQRVNPFQIQIVFEVTTQFVKHLFQQRQQHQKSRTGVKLESVDFQTGIAAADMVVLFK